MNEELQTEKNRSEKLSNENLILQKTLETSISDFEIKIENFESKKICQEKQNLDCENEKKIKIDHRMKYKGFHA